MNSFLLQYCVGVVWMASSAGHPLHLQDPHRIQKRQGEVNCEEVAHDERCTNGYYQDIANVYQRCNNFNLASTYQDRCTSNPMGGYCVSDFTMIACDTFSSDCSQECRNSLVAARNRQGCCIQSVYNDSSTPFYNPSAYRSSLWSSCGVEPVTQECPSSTVTVSPITVDPTCNNSETLAQLLYSTRCKRQYRQAILDRLSQTEGCQNIQTDFSFCASNRIGTYCAAVLGTSSRFFTIGSEICSNTSTCDPHCIETLNNIINTVGCCFNDRYNSTGAPRNWLSYEFWSRCNLTSPGCCELRFTDGIEQNYTTTTSTTAETSSILPTAADTILPLIIGTVCCVLVVLTIITISVICLLKCKKKSETPSQHNEKQQRGGETYDASKHNEKEQRGETDKEEHEYDYIKERNEDFQVKENIAYGKILRQEK